MTIFFVHKMEWIVWTFLLFILSIGVATTYNYLTLNVAALFKLCNTLNILALIFCFMFVQNYTKLRCEFGKIVNCGLFNGLSFCWIRPVCKPLILLAKMGVKCDFYLQVNFLLIQVFNVSITDSVHSEIILALI